MRATCLLFTAPFEIEFGTTDIPDPGPGEVLVETIISCVSPGTEGRCLAGRQRGAPAFPFIPGYSSAGVILKAGRDAGTSEGTRVFASGTVRAAHALSWGGHCSHLIVPASKALPLPPGLGFLDASAAKLAAIACHGVARSQPEPGERVACIGLGPIGFLSAQIHALAGAEVRVTDRIQQRLEAASRAGLQVCPVRDPLRETFALEWPDGCEIAVDATGSPAVFKESILLPRIPPWSVDIEHPSRLLIMGSYTEDPVLRADAGFLRELHILFSRDNLWSDIKTVLGLMGEGKLFPGVWLEEVGGPETAPDIYRQFREEPERRIGAAFRWCPDPV